MFKNFIELLKTQENSLYTIITIIIASILTYAILKIKNSTQILKNKRGGKLLIMLVESSFISIILLIWLNIFVNKNNFLLQFLGNAIVEIIMKIKSISTRWLIWLSLSRFVKQLEIGANNNEIFRFIKDKNIVKFVSKILTIVIYVIMGSLVMNVLGMKIDQIFTLLGGSAVAIGFATKNILERSLSGIFIQASGKFKVGDLINLPEKNITGRVAEIGTTATKIIMHDLQPIIIPNEIFNANLLINSSDVSHRCVIFDLNVPSKFSSEIQIIIQQIKNVLEKLDMVQNVIVLCANITDFNVNDEDWFIIINVKAFLKTKDVAIAKNIKSQLIIKSMNVVNVITKEKNKKLI